MEQYKYEVEATPRDDVESWRPVAAFANLTALKETMKAMWLDRWPDLFWRYVETDTGEIYNFDRGGSWQK